MVTEHRLPVTRACRAAGLSWAAYYKTPPLPQEKDAEVIDALNGVVERNGRWGFWKCFDRLRLDGRPWNHKRVWRVYCELGLNIPRRTKRRIPKREALAIQVAPSLPASMLIRTMDRLVDWYGAPKSIRMDNGPEMTSREFVAWAQRRGIALNDIEPGEPNQNAYIERFNRTLRTEVLDAWLFNSIQQVQAIADDWLTQYNEYRPHDAWAARHPGSSCPD